MALILQGCLFTLLCIQTSLTFDVLHNHEAQSQDLFSEWNIGNLVVRIGKNVIVESKPRIRGTEASFTGELGINYIKELGLPILCGKQKDSICLKWSDKIQVTIKKLNNLCHEVEWNSTVKTEDCISYGNASWYGGPEFSQQMWPIETMKFSNLPYVTSFTNNMGVVEPFWFSSKGIFLFVHYDVPLFIDSNSDKNKSLCLISNTVNPYNSKDRNPNLKYMFCQLDNPRKAREYAVVNKFINKPTNIPDTRMIEYPIWSTWVQFYYNINDKKILNFTKYILSYGFNNSQLEIDDKWETCYGSKVIDTKRFPNMRNFVDTIKQLGFRITLWTHPFVNLNCNNYTAMNAKKLFVANKKDENIVTWWDGKGSVYDFTNITAKKWFQTVHQNLLDEYNLDGFKFDAGECQILPKDSILNADSNEYPKSYTLSYINTISTFGNISETRVGYRSSHYPIYVRMLDKDSKWGWNNGLRTLIPTCLTFNIQGYTWVLPDMVGGNKYGSDVITEELFIRWLQANTFMPVIQFSYAPWNFKNQTIIDITKKFTSLHYSYSGKIIKLMKETVQTGAPLNPPIWWIDPKDPVALTVNDEYLLGEEILVAPVLEKNARKRDVYLPRGTWQDGNNESNIIVGPCWAKEYAADLSILPYFIKKNSTF